MSWIFLCPVLDLLCPPLSFSALAKDSQDSKADYSHGWGLLEQNYTNQEQQEKDVYSGEAERLGMRFWVLGPLGPPRTCCLLQQWSRSMCATWLCPGKPQHPRLFENGSHINIMLHDQACQVKLRIPTMTPDAHRCLCLYKAIRWTENDHEPVNIRTFSQGWSIVKSQFPVPLTYKDQTTRSAVLTISSHFIYFI